MAILMIAYGVEGYVNGGILLPIRYGSREAFEGKSASLLLAAICCFAVVLSVRSFDRREKSKAAVIRTIEKTGLALTAIFGAVAIILKTG